jgi:NADPH-dependent 2,4-dienoyl-CoA reductase/sulfur reductase-like enzyme
MKYRKIIFDRKRQVYISYAQIAVLPYYIGGVIEDRENLFLQTPQSFGKRFNVDVRTQSEAIKINAEKKEIEIKHKGETYTESYDKLVLSPGASPFKPNLKGIRKRRYFYIKNVNDTDLIKKYVQSKKINNAVVIRAPEFIGHAKWQISNLHHLGAKVSIVE